MQSLHWPRISKCCCCSLKTGVLVLAWFTTILSALNVLGSIKEFASLHNIEVILEQELGEKCDAKCINFVRNFVLCGSITSFIINFIYLVIGCLMLYGVHKSRPNLLTPFVVISIISSIICGIFWIVCLVFLAPFPLPAFLFTLIMFGMTALTMYFTLVVKNYQYEVNEALGVNPIPLHEEGGFRNFA